MSRSWRLCLDTRGRPTTTNKVDKMHPIARAVARHGWRDDACVLALAQRIPRLSAVDVRVMARYRTRVTPADIDATAPTVKGVLDGLVLAGVIEDDRPPFVRSLHYITPQSGTSLPDALLVWIEEAAVADVRNMDGDT